MLAGAAAAAADGASEGADAGADGNKDVAPEPELEDRVPQRLVCPISHRVMDLPVISPSGHTYDRTSIMAWLGRRPVDPLSLTPLLASSLYPNRALQDEIVNVLEDLASSADDRSDSRLAAAARAKLASVNAARFVSTTKGSECVEMGRLDRVAGLCAGWAIRWGLLAWEQALVVATSFGALLCLGVDTGHSLWMKTTVNAREATRPDALLSSFLRLATSPCLALPRHWRPVDRVAILALRCVLLVPLAPMSLALLLGGLLSLARFGQRCAEVRAAEVEHAAENRWFMGAVHCCSSIAGVSSLCLFMRLYYDRPRARQLAIN